MIRTLNRPGIALAAVGIVAALLRFTALSRPPELMFDEVYYMKDGCLYAGYSWETCRIDSKDEKYWVRERDEVGSWVHPPLGKWMIAAGEMAFGATPFGWRVAAATAGTVTVVLAAGIALLLFGKPVWAFLTGLLLATECLHFVQSRVALLDVFLALWVTLGFLLLLLDRRWIGRRAPPSDALEANGEGPGSRTVEPVVSPFWRPWRLSAGLAFGAAVATKWSGLWALGGALLLSLFWERTRRALAGVPKPFLKGLWQEGAGIIAFLVFVPAIVYVAAFARFWVLHGPDVGAWLDLHRAAAEFHTGLARLKEDGTTLVHAYSSLPWEWPLLVRPVNFHFTGEGTHVLSVGNPVVFWTSLITVPWLVASWRRRRDQDAGFLFVAIAAQYLPWFWFAGRVQFLFYMTPIVPFLVLALVYLLRDLADYRPAGARAHPFRPVAAGVVVVSIGAFAFLYPVLTAVPLSAEAWSWRMLLPGWR